VEWQHRLKESWAALRFGDVTVETRGEQHVFEVRVDLGNLDPNAVRVELYADAATSDPPVRQGMKRVRQLAGPSADWVYAATVSAARPAEDYTARVMPHFEGVAIPLEDARVLWQR
jgi:starch phosphorylase